MTHHLRPKDAQYQLPQTSHSRRWLATARPFQWERTTGCLSSWASSTAGKHPSCRTTRLTTSKQAMPLTSRCGSAWFRARNLPEKYQGIGLGGMEAITIAVLFSEHEPVPPADPGWLPSEFDCRRRWATDWWWRPAAVIEAAGVEPVWQLPQGCWLLILSLCGYWVYSWWVTGERCHSAAVQLWPGGKKEEKRKGAHPIHRVHIVCCICKRKLPASTLQSKQERYMRSFPPFFMKSRSAGFAFSMGRSKISFGRTRLDFKVVKIPLD